MKMKLGELVEARLFLAKQAAREKLDPKVVYRLAKIVRIVDAELSDFNKVNHKLVMKYGKPKDDDSGLTQVTSENLDAYNTEIEPLKEEEVDLEVPKIQIDKLMPGLSANDIIMLGWMLDIPVDYDGEVSVPEPGISGPEAT